VPFKPTQGRPVLCRSCFQLKRVPSGVAAVANMDSAAAQVQAASDALDVAFAAAAEPSPTSFAATMEMIADAPNLVADNLPSPELVAAEAAQN
jgi:hypothetical protein